MIGRSDNDVVFWLMISMLVALLGTAAQANPQTVESVLSFLTRQTPVGFPIWFYGLALAVIVAAIGIGLYDRHRIRAGGFQHSKREGNHDHDS